MPSTDSFNVLFAVIPIVIGVVFVLIVVLLVVNVIRIRRRGHNPLTLQSDLATRLMDSGLLKPDQPLETRLSEIDRLRDQGTITAAEHEAARARILAGG